MNNANLDTIPRMQLLTACFELHNYHSGTNNDFDSSISVYHILQSHIESPLFENSPLYRAVQKQHPDTFPSFLKNDLLSKITLLKNPQTANINDIEMLVKILADVFDELPDEYTTQYLAA